MFPKQSVRNNHFGELKRTPELLSILGSAQYHLKVFISGFTFSICFIRFITLSNYKKNLLHQLKIFCFLFSSFTSSVISTLSNIIGIFNISGFWNFSSSSSFLRNKHVFFCFFPTNSTYKSHQLFLVVQFPATLKTTSKKRFASTLKKVHRNNVEKNEKIEKIFLPYIKSHATLFL